MNSSIPHTLLHMISETVSPDALETQLGPLFEVDATFELPWKAVYGREFPEQFLISIDKAYIDKQQQIEAYIRGHSKVIYW